MTRLIPEWLPENFGERKALQYLDEHLPEHFVIYHNIELTASRGGHPWEYDAVVYNENRVWVLEIKGWAGEIQGNCLTWKLSNGNYEHSPVDRTNIKARILSSLLEQEYGEMQRSDTQKIQKPMIYVEAIVVLANDNVWLSARLERHLNCQVLRLDELCSYLMSAESQKPKIAPGELVSRVLAQRYGHVGQKLPIGQYIRLDEKPFSQSDTSVTYMAAHQHLKTMARVSLKMIQVDPVLTEKKRKDKLNQVYRHADVLMTISPHPNIARFYEVFPWEHDQVVMVTEWIDGLTLYDELANGITWSNYKRLRTIYDICQGLDHAHRHKVFHRSLTPANMVINENGEAVLVGFDMAKASGLSSMETGWMQDRLDTFYTDLEVLKQPHNTTEQSDIYSVGMIFGDLMKGCLPAKDILDLQKRKESHLQIMGADFREVYIRMCAEKHPDRYTSMTEVLEDLEILISGLDTNHDNA